MEGWDKGGIWRWGGRWPGHVGRNTGTIDLSIITIIISIRTGPAFGLRKNLYRVQVLGVGSCGLAVGELPAIEREVSGGDRTTGIRISAYERSKFEQV